MLGPISFGNPPVPPVGTVPLTAQVACHNGGAETKEREMIRAYINCTCEQPASTKKAETPNIKICALGSQQNVKRDRERICPHTFDGESDGSGERRRENQRRHGRTKNG